MKTFFFNYFYTGSAAIIFFGLALVDLLANEDKNDPNRWAHTWDYLSLFGKIDTLLSAALLLWTIGVVLVKSKWK